MLLINAVKDVATALGELISATKNASGKSANDPAMSMLKDSAKVGAVCERPFPDSASSYDVFSALCLTGLGHHHAPSHPGRAPSHLATGLLI